MSTIISLISYFFAGLLLWIHYTDQSPGMIMVFMIPLLIAGLLFGIIAIIIKKMKNLELNQVFIRLHNMNLALIVLGIGTLIYALYE